MLHEFAKRLGMWIISKDLTVPLAGAANRYEELAYLKSLLRAQRINCVIDVGANRGQFAAELRAIGYGDLIFSFEPVARSFVELERAFRDDPLWRGRQIALGRESGEAIINVTPRLTEISSLLTPVGDWGGVEQETIMINRLDDVFDEIVKPVLEPRVFLKLDTQGYDLAVFDGARECRNRVEVLQAELSIVPLYENMPTYLEALSTFQNAGFDPRSLAVVSRGSEGELVELNCVMTRNRTEPRLGGDSGGRHPPSGAGR